MRNAPSITQYPMYSDNAHRGKPGGSVCTTYNVRQHCHSKQLTVKVQCLWHRHVAVHSIQYKQQCPWHKHAAVHSIQYKRQYTAYNISGSAHSSAQHIVQVAVLPAKTRQLVELGGTQKFKTVRYFIKYHGINNYHGI